MEKEALKEVDISQISLNPHQPRKEFSREEVQELADSIASVGLIHPPTVRPLQSLSSKKGYELISGERRLRALTHLNIKKTFVVVKQITPHHSAQAALIENIQRIDLNPMEIAQALHKVMQQEKLTQGELAVKVGKKRSTVANYLRLLNLEEKIQEGLIKKTISMGHAKVLLSLEDEKSRLNLYNLILKQKMTVRSLEKKVWGQKKTPRKKQPLEEDLFYLVDSLQKFLGTKVEILTQGNEKGKIVLDYYSLDDFSRLLEKIGVCNHEL